MKEVVKMKENIFTEPIGTMPMVGAMQHMQANPNVLPAQTIPNVSPVQNAPKESPMQSAPNVSPIKSVPGGNVSPVQTLPENMPIQPSPAAIMPSSMNQMPVMSQMPMMNQIPNMGQMPMMSQMPNMGQMPIMCCPYLMNMQCPMTYGSNTMGMNMLNNMMYPAVSPASGNMGALPGMGSMPGMSTLPAMDNRYHYQY